MNILSGIWNSAAVLRGHLLNLKTAAGKLETSLASNLEEQKKVTARIAELEGQQLSLSRQTREATLRDMGKKIARDGQGRTPTMERIG